MATIARTGNGQITTNFHISEMKCKDGSLVPDNLIPNAIKALTNLQALRDYLKEPIHINSGYRSPAWNAHVKGEKNSYHMKAMATDITVKSKTPKQLAAIIEKLIKEGKMVQGGLGIYPGFVHTDVRGTKARW